MTAWGGGGWLSDPLLPFYGVCVGIFFSRRISIRLRFQLSFYNWTEKHDEHDFYLLSRAGQKTRVLL